MSDCFRAAAVICGPVIRWDRTAPIEVVGRVAGALALACLCSCHVAAAEAVRSNAPPPAPSAQVTTATAEFRLKPGLRIDLVAAEPLIAAPVAMAFDENGRLFVAEMPNAGGQRGTNGPMGRVRLLEDTDGTGEFHTSTIYADKLPGASALACYGGGVFVAAGPEILFLKDTRTNGIADVRRLVFTISTAADTKGAQGLVNNFNWGIDNRIHAASAGSADDAIASRTRSGAPVPLDTSFSFDPRALTVASDSIPARSGLAFDNWGREFVCDFTRPLRVPLLPPRYRLRNPFYPPPEEMADVLSPATAIFALGAPASSPPSASPAQAAGKDAAAPRATPSVVTTWLTNAQGCAVYRGNSALPTNYVGNAFIPDPSAHLIHRAVLREAGLSWVAARASDERRSEFLRSADPAFRPVQVINGPDGALYVVDARDGGERGRIYRITREGFKAGKLPSLGKARTLDLVGTLSHPDDWHRDTAARLLYERHDPEAVEPLTELLACRLPLARLQALQALDGLGALRPIYLLTALRDTSELVREDAVRLTEKQARGGVLPDALWNQLRLMAADPSLRVRRQLALTLGTFHQPGSARVLADILWLTLGNPLMEAAVFSSLADGAGEAFTLLARDPRVRGTPAGQRLLRRLATMIGVRSDPRQVVQVVGFLGRASFEPSQALPLVTALGDGLRHAGSSLERMDPQGQLRRYYSDAANLLFGSSSSDPLRVMGIELLSVSSSTFSDTGDLLLLPLGSGQSASIQSAAIATLASYDDLRVAPALIRRWGTLTPELRREALGDLLSRDNRGAFILDALEAGNIPRADVTPLAANLLRTDRDPAVANRAVRLLGPLSAQRPEVVQRYKPALGLPGVPPQGRSIFVARCAACHQPAASGAGIGPELATARIYGKERTFTAILEPSFALRPGYETCVLETRGGDVFWGVLPEGNATTVTLRQLSGDAITFPRANIPYLQPRAWSLMPDGLEDGLKPQDLANLLAYLTAAPFREP